MSVTQRLRSKWVLIPLVVIALVVVVWLALPALVTNYVNHRLARLERYRGKVDGVTLNLWKGQYRLEGLRIDARQARKRPPVLSAPVVDLSVEWGPLLRGMLVAEVDLREPVINQLTAPEIEEPEREQPIYARLREMDPFRIDRFAIHDGELHYRNYETDPPTHAYVRDVELVVRNVTNSTELAKSLFARFEGKGVAMDSGSLKLEGRANPNERRPTFDIDATVTGLEIQSINDFLEESGGIRVAGGHLSLNIDWNAARGRLQGMTQASVRDIRATDLRIEEGGPLKRLWDVAQKAVSEVDGPEPRVATARVPVDVRLEEPGAQAWSIAGDVLNDAFTTAIRRSLEKAFRVPGRPREN